MIHIKPRRVFVGKINFRFQNGLNLSSMLSRCDSMINTKISPHFSSLSPYNIGSPEFFRRHNFRSYTESRRASKHLTRADQLSENLGDGKMIPITIVTRFLDQNPEIKTKDSKEKFKSVLVTEEANSSGPKKALHETVSTEIAAETKAASASKAAMPHSKTGSLRNEGTKIKSQRPKTNGENIHFKETYEKLKRLGLLSTRLGNCCVGMTSPSGKYKFETEKTAPRKKGVGAGATPSDLLKKLPKKLPEIKSKFLQNNVVVKVRHFYESQGKEMPDDLKTLASGRSLRHRADASGRSPYQAKQRRFQLYPCTSPSQTQFTRNFKNVK